jgi:hypothetical protein
MKPIRLSLLNIFLICNYISGIAQVHPHLLVHDMDKSIINSKIQQQVWAGNIYREIEKNITPYVDRHLIEPEWILSRYLMNRVPGKRYTRFYSDESGTLMAKYEGDAPYPTVRVSPHKRSPVTITGASFGRPSIEELVPYDTSWTMHLLNLETDKKEWIDPQALVGDINGEINDMALDAAIVYWLRGDDKYAKFAADILDQWVKGAFYQEPIIGPCRTGFLDMQTLGDRSHLSLILAYDFVYPFMKQNGYDLHYYETVFEKFAFTLAFRGLWNNNWYAAESSTLVFASLSLENPEKRDYYLQFYLSKDTINGGCGQLALPSTVEKWLTPDGHWKEPGGYHNFPVTNLLVSALALEKNGYDIFRRFPELFRASYAMLKYSFPNLTVSAFGDTGRASQSPESLEIGLLGAVKYNQPELPEMLASMKKLIEGGRYWRESSGYLGLLCFLPELPSVESVYTWPRSGSLEFARYFLQRNGTDPQYGLMYGVQGASYNHNHCNGMAMELYGLGEVMGIDAGTGPTYEHPLHVNYFSQWAAHNTVVAAGSSSSVPFNGNAGRKDIGQIELAAMEPMPEHEAVSPLYSFTDTRYFDKSTKTSQMRTMALIRTSGESGYYVDIYRSDNKEGNDYVYHNTGDELTFFNSKREPLAVVESDYPLKGKDYPGFRYFKEVKKLEKWSDNLVALFTIKDDQANEMFMQVLVPGTSGRTYYQAKSLKTKTSGRQYYGKTLPVFTMHDKGESKNRAFIALFEPFRERNNYSVEKISVEYRNDGADFTAMTVYNRDKSKQLIFQAVDIKKIYKSGKGTFCGYFGIVGFTGENVSSLYLGEGKELFYGGYSINTDGTRGSASLSLSGKNYLFSSDQNCIIGLPVTNPKSVCLESEGKRTILPAKETDTGISFSIPKAKNGIIIIEQAQ